MLRPLRRWWLRWRIECEERELLRASIEGYAGSAYTANALMLIDRWRAELELIEPTRA